MKYLLLLLLIGGMAACNETNNSNRNAIYVVKVENGTLHEYCADSLYKIGDTIMWDNFSGIKGVIIRKSK